MICWRTLSSCMMDNCRMHSYASWYLMIMIYHGFASLSPIFSPKSPPLQGPVWREQRHPRGQRKCSRPGYLHGQHGVAPAVLGLHPRTIVQAAAAVGLWRAGRCASQRRAEELRSFDGEGWVRSRKARWKSLGKIKIGMGWWGMHGYLNILMPEVLQDDVPVNRRWLLLW